LEGTKAQTPNQPQLPTNTHQTGAAIDNMIMLNGTMHLHRKPHIVEALHA
jgi:hypothetical protein